MDDHNDPGPAAVSIEVVRGGDPGDDLVAALATLLTEPLALPAGSGDAPALTAWVRAARSEGVTGQRVRARTDLQ